MNINDKKQNTQVYTNPQRASLVNNQSVNNQKENILVETSNRKIGSHFQKTETSQKLIDSFELALGKEETQKGRGIEKEYIIAKTGNPREDKYDEIILKMARKYELDPNLIKAVIKQESTFDPKKVSKRNAKGLMQLMDVTIKDIKRISGYEVKDPFDPRQNIEGGSIYLSWLLKKYNGNLDLALAAYNAGPGAVDRAKGIPQNGETPDFVKKVKQYYQEYTEMIKK
ncbi:MAG: lytic transglycosylase domain-containing protein [bacterium]